MKIQGTSHQDSTHDDIVETRKSELLLFLRPIFFQDMIQASSREITTAAFAVLGAGFLYLYSESRDYSLAKHQIPPALMKSQYSEELKLAVKLAKRAGDNMKGYIESKGTSDAVNFSLDIEIKSGSADFCTKVDVENENLIMEGIQEVFPSHEIIGEESTGTGEVPELTKKPTWIIDPIDGTTKQV